MSNWLLVYRPLISSPKGRRILGFPCYEDASPRREPTFGPEVSFVSGLCRPRDFHKRAVKGNLLFYVSAQDRSKHGLDRQLMAILEVNEVLHSHKEAKVWFDRHGIRPSPNCVLADGDMSNCIDEKFSVVVHTNWPEVYRERSERSPKYAICKTLWLKPDSQLCPVDISKLNLDFHSLQAACQLQESQVDILRRIAHGFPHQM